MSKKIDDVLKKPVHAVVLRPRHLQDLQKRGKLLNGGVIRTAPSQQTLPVKEKKKKRYNPLAGFDIKSVTKPARDAMRKTRLRVLHDSIPPLPKDKQPPCNECVTSACCVAFVVSISEEEYESGQYDPYAVKLAPEVVRQLRGKTLLSTTATSPVHSIGEQTEHYLEGKLGEPCPFLLSGGKCGIYDQRPITCRVYSCVGDDRITPGMRDGTEPIFSELAEAVRIGLYAKD